MDLPYYQYEFERKKRWLEARWRQGRWLNNEVKYVAICLDLNLVDGLGKPIKKAEKVVEEEERQEKDERLEFKLKLKQEPEEIQ